MTATVIIRFKKDNSFWSAFISRIERKSTHIGADGMVTASFDVKDYNLQDHQFVRLKVRFNKRDALVLIPRTLVHVIIEGKALKEDTLGFLGGHGNSEVGT